PSWRRRDRAARRIRAWGLPALRRDGAIFSGDERGPGVRRTRRSGARHLQRLSGPPRGGPAARRHAAESWVEISVRAGPRPRRADRYAVHRRVPPRSGAADADRARGRQLLRRAGRHRAARGESAGDFSLHHGRRRGARRCEPEWIGGGDRRPLQRCPQRRRADASPRARLRARARRRRRQGPVRIRHSMVGGGAGAEAAASGPGARRTMIDRAVLDRHGLAPDEYDRIVELLGREPNLTELGIFSVMWSEHCSYKSSRVHLKTLPTRGPQVLQGPGENAGAIDIGNGLAAVFKIESHNHPSFIEPYQGAATGVGGIIRDIFTMGARPIALLNSLRFVELDAPG